jgi:hypothetical protein
MYRGRENRCFHVVWGGEGRTMTGLAAQEAVQFERADVRPRCSAIAGQTSDTNCIVNRNADEVDEEG